MGIYYNFYLEIFENNKWRLFSKLDNYYLRRSNAYLFLDNYFLCKINYLDISKELIEKYNLLNKGEMELMFYKNSFCLFNLEKMIGDFNNDLHDYDGIISHQDYKKIKEDIEYYPKIIDVKEFNKLPQSIKCNYGYYKWDDYISEYRYLYELIPLVKNVLERIDLNDIRLIAFIG